MHVVALIFIFSAAAWGATVTIATGVSTTCAFADTPLDPAALWTACASIPACASMFNEATFAAEIASSAPFPLPLVQESAMRAAFCGLTFEQAASNMWVMESLLSGRLQGTACALGERFVNGACVTQPDVTINDCTTYYWSSVGLLSALLALIIVGCVCFILYVLCYQQTAKATSGM